MNNKRTIVHLITSLKMGGAESLLVDFLAFSQSKQQQHVAVIYFHEGPNVARLRELGIPLFHIQGIACLYDPIFFIRLYRTLKKLKPSLLHTWLWSANMTGRIIGTLLGIPVINSFHNNVDQDGPLRSFLDKYSQWMATQLIAVSDGVAHSLQQHHRSAPQKIQVIKNGIQAETITKRGYAAQKSRTQWGLHDYHFIIGSVGRFVPLKNYPFLLATFASLAREFEQVRLVLIGGGPEEQKLRLLTKEYDIENKVHFVIGQQSYGFYPLFDCFVLSSYKEGISIALLEAMSFGLPCISTYEGGNHDVIQPGENGLLVPWQEKEGSKTAQTGLNLAIKRLIIDNKKAQILGKNARKTVEERLSLTNMVDSYEKIYSKCFKYSNKFIDKYSICN